MAAQAISEGIGFLTTDAKPFLIFTNSWHAPVVSRSAHVTMGTRTF
jgi:hypothetical protein